VGPGEDPALFLPPAALIGRGAAPETIVAFVQEAAVRVLEEVTNHWTMSRPSGRRQHPELARRVDAVIRIAEALDSRGLRVLDAPVRASRDPASQALACVAFARHVVQQLAVPLAETSVVVGEKRPQEPRPRLHDFGSRNDGLAGLARRAEGSIEGLYVQGSVALGDMTPFSDLDGIILLAPSAERSLEALRRAAREISKSARLLVTRDPLQHHGWQVFAPFLLEAFPEETLPLDSLREGVVVFGPDGLSIRPFRCRLAARRRLWSMVQVFRDLALSRSASKPRGLHESKMLLSQFMLLPALYAQATGRYVSKRVSFCLVRDELPNLPWDIMDEASELRVSWTQPDFGVLWQGIARVTGAWEAQALWRRTSRSHTRASAYCQVPSPWYARMDDLAENLLLFAEATNRGSATT
jgi:hypothetical protein